MQVRTDSDGTIRVRCRWCKRWHPDREHDYEACEAAYHEAADHKRRERIEEKRET